MTKKEFGKWLVSTRSSLKLSQDQFAKALGFTGKEIAKIEAGIVEFPKSKVHALGLMLKVEKKFELQLKVIFHDESKEKKKIA
jgi:predicted transcriptional regulator